MSIKPGTRGAFQRDESGHWYFVPEGRLTEFDKWSLDDGGDDPDRFNDFQAAPFHYIVTWTGERAQ